MRIIFAGTPAFAAASLDSIIHSQHQVIAVLSQPDRPSGRGRRLKPGPVKQLAHDHNIDVLQPLSLKDGDIQARLAVLNADVMVVVAYGLLLPPAVLQLPRYGCLNVHGSLLPRWRGAAPIQRAIEAGDEQTGISIMQMDAGLDTGDVLKMEALPIDDTDTASSLHDKLAVLGARLIVDTLDRLQAGRLDAQPQDENGACYAAKLDRQESLIDWQLSARQIVRKIHAFNPWPGAKTRYQTIEVKLTRARTCAGDTGAAPGTIINCDKTIIIQAADQGVEILELQKPGARPMPAEAFLNGFELSPGAQFN